MQKRPHDDDSDSEQRMANLARTQAGSPRGHPELDRTPTDFAKPDTEEMPRPQSPSIFSVLSHWTQCLCAAPDAPPLMQSAVVLGSGASGYTHDDVRCAE
jgi:hypothetical protein